jgi:P-type Ca2+ transporter type 2C
MPISPGTTPVTRWHALPAGEAATRLEVKPEVGLSSAEATARLERYGPNRLDEAAREPRWRAFLRQFQDLLIIVLLVAAVVSLLNSTIGFVQGSRAEAALGALRRWP